jgi:N-acetylglucosaminyl-diphospho-decaprenol L-rhamnosyltransferase
MAEARSMNRSQPRVTVVMVAYQSHDTIGEALDTLAESYAAGLVDVVVVDNDSNDATADLVADRYHRLKLIPSEENIGFGRGCNLGFQQVKTPYILLLNPDATLSLQALTRMVEFLDEHPRVGICGPTVREVSGVHQPAGGLPTPSRVMFKPLLRGWASRDQWHVIEGDAPRETNWICASIMLLRSAMIDEIGGFDPRFFLYFEETDLCYRALQAGWRIWTVGQAVAGHVNAASAKTTNLPMFNGTISEHYFRSRHYYLSKHYGRGPAVAAELGEIVTMVIRSGIELARGRSYPNLRPRLKSPILKMPASCADHADAQPSSGSAR